MCVDNKTMKAEKRELKGEEEDFDMTHISDFFLHLRPKIDSYLI